MSRILLVEDEWVSQILIKWLDARGHRVLQVDTMTDALTELIWSKHAYDAVVVDMNLPFGECEWDDLPTDLNNMHAGGHIIEEVRKAEGSPNQHTWFVVVSAWASAFREQHWKLRQDPKCLVFEKGGDPDEILHAILRCVGD